MMKPQKFLNKKIILGGLAMLLAFAFIIISSFVPYIIDPTQWQTKEFLGDQLIIIAIIIFSIMSTMFIGQASNAQNPKSEIAKAKVLFNDIVDKVTDISRFNQWVKKVLQPRDTETIQQRVMRKAGIDDFDILKLDRTEIKALIDTPQKFGDRFYKSISKKQARVLLDIKDGEYRIYLVEPSYYLSVKSIDSNKTITERSGTEATKKSILLAWSTFSKIVLTVLVSMIFASLVKDTASDTIPTTTALLKFTSRMLSMSTSAFMGYVIGCQINDIDASYINMRVLVIKECLQDTTFKYKSQQELAKEEYIDRVKSENIKLLNNK